MLNKLKNNNKGTSAVNLILIVFMALALICLLVDFFNIITIKRTLASDTDTLVSAFCYQGGFSPSCPKDWTDMFGASGKENYLTRNQAVSLLKNTMKQTFIDDITPEIQKNGRNINNGNNWKLEYKEEAVLTCQIKYRFMYTSMIGFKSPQKIMKRSLPVCGFWIHKTTEV